MQSHFSHNKVSYLIPICNFGHKFTELHYFNKTFYFWDTKYFLMYSGSYHMKFLLIEIGLQFFIRPYLDYDQKYGAQTHSIKLKSLKLLKITVFGGFDMHALV